MLSLKIIPLTDKERVLKKNPFHHYHGNAVLYMLEIYQSLIFYNLSGLHYIVLHYNRSSRLDSHILDF